MQAAVVLCPRFAAGTTVRPPGGSLFPSRLIGHKFVFGLTWETTYDTLLAMRSFPLGPHGLSLCR